MGGGVGVGVGATVAVAVAVAVGVAVAVAVAVAVGVGVGVGVGATVAVAVAVAVAVGVGEGQPAGLSQRPALAITREKLPLQVANDPIYAVTPMVVWLPTGRVAIKESLLLQAAIWVAPGATDTTL